MNEDTQKFSCFIILLALLSLTYAQIPNLNCTFEKDYCLWINSSSIGDLYWTRFKGPLSYGPPGDHTFLTGNGSYIYISTNASQIGATARLVGSEMITTIFEQHCFTFWYYMFGFDLSTLNINLLVNRQRDNSTYWSKTGSQGKGWNLAKINFDLNPNIRYNIEIEGIIGGQQGTIVIDDTYLVEGQCEPDVPSVSCNFEQDYICGYRTDQTLAMKWKRFSGSIETYETGPINDVTLGSIHGHYMLFDATETNAIGSIARLESPVYSNTTGLVCLDYYYNAYGSDVGTLNVYLNQSGQLVKIDSTSYDQGKSWRLSRTQLQLVSQASFIFEGIKGSGLKGNLGIDDVNLVTGSCRNILNCDFESGCTWTFVKDQRAQITWIINSGATDSYDTGPSTDATGSPSRSYAYIEASYPAKEGDRALLQSVVLNPNKGSPKCMKFYYHMYGADTGTLSVYIQRINATLERPGDVKWTLAGPKNNSWFQAQTQIESDTAFYIIIDGMVGKGYRSDIAIDEITIEDASCDVLPSEAQPSNSTSINCSFETDTCGWYDDIFGDFRWTRHKGSTSTTSTGPSFDHTFGNSSGWYMYTETSAPRLPGQKARLINRNFIKQGEKGCFTFWFHMYGFDVDVLNVYLMRDDGTMSNSIWSRKGNLGDM